MARDWSKDRSVTAQATSNVYKSAEDERKQAERQRLEDEVYRLAQALNEVTDLIDYEIGLDSSQRELLDSLFNVEKLIRIRRTRLKNILEKG